jgi:uroporphyrinogen decarboxylase
VSNGGAGRAFEPDYRNLVDAAFNRRPARLPLYEHAVGCRHMEEVLGLPAASLLGGTTAERARFHRRCIDFYLAMGYDAIPFERGVCTVVQDSACLSGRVPGIIRDRADLRRFSVEDLAARYFALWDTDLSLLAEALPPGMKAVGGAGNGLFEVVQDFVGYEALCLLRADDPELYTDVFRMAGELLVTVWKRFLESHRDTFAVLRFGDDLGYKASTLLSPEDVRAHVFPVYRCIVDMVHASGTPFLLHSCGNIFALMDGLIDEVGIDAKHSNEDEIAPFAEWVDRYGDRIGNFGGIDLGSLCRLGPAEIERAVRAILERVEGHGGIAFASGNSIPACVPTANYLAIVHAVREHRGERTAGKRRTAT